MINSVVILGNLTHDPEVRYGVTSDQEVARTRIASNLYNDKVCYIDVTCFGQRAEFLAKYFTRGSRIIVDGHLVTDTWEDNDGNKRSKTYIVADNIEFGDTCKEDNNGAKSGRYKYTKK